jgi:glycosyltransferase involved in cell wall biosynthesis
MPKVLLLTYHFPPSAASGVFRLLGFAQHLPRHGWSCVVVAPPLLPWEPVDAALVAGIPADTLVVRVPYPEHLPKVVRWAIPYAVWLPYARRAAAKAIVLHRPDVVLTSGPPHCVHLLGRFVQKTYRLPWVADFRDPWITDESGGGPTTWKERCELYWERQVMRRADVILANAPGACALFQSAYPAFAGKMSCLTNGYDPDSFPEQRPAGTAGREGPVRILHAGELYAGRDPRPLLDAIASIPAGTVPPFRLELLGRANYEKGADLPAEARKRGIEPFVLCRGQIGYRQVLAEMCSADVLLLIDSPGRKVGVPAKLYEYLGAGRPILATGEEDSDTAAILRDSGVAHRIVPCGDVARIRQALVELVQGVATGQVGSGTSEQRLRFSRQALAGRLAAMLDELTVGKERR